LLETSTPKEGAVVAGKESDHWTKRKEEEPGTTKAPEKERMVINH
jgi:hypothetical protein